MTIVLDASAVLALIQDEPEAERVRGVARLSVLSAVNLTEVVTKLVARGVPEDEVRAILEAIEPSVHPHDEALAIAAGAIYPRTRGRGLSLGDRACLALARSLGATALTTDRAWAELDVGVAVEVIR